jgi:hypothetical protein
MFRMKQSLQTTLARMFGVKQSLQTTLSRHLQGEAVTTDYASPHVRGEAVTIDYAIPTCSGWSSHYRLRYPDIFKVKQSLQTTLSRHVQGEAVTTDYASQECTRLSRKRTVIWLFLLQFIWLNDAKQINVLIHLSFINYETQIQEF